MVKRLCIVVFLILFGSQVVSRASYADSAQVLPKGRFSFGSTGKYFFPIEHRFDPRGDVEDIATNFNATLDSDVFPNLSLVEAAFGLPSGFASIGKSIVDFEVQASKIDLSFRYGITDRLTAGINVPYWWSRNKVDSVLDPSGATVGKSRIGAGFGASIVPLAGGGPFGDAVPLTTEDTQDLLAGGMDVDGNGTIDVPGFGYKRFKTWREEGIGDVAVGLRYQYLKGENWRLACTGGAKVPTGHIDDPDNLVDFPPFTTGAFTPFLHLNSDFTGIKNLVINNTIRYYLLLPRKEELRVLDNVNRPLTANKEKVSRDLGDRLEVELSGYYNFPWGVNFFTTYQYLYIFKDRVSGDRGFAYEEIEKETDTTAHDVKIGFSYNTLSLYREKRFPIPLNAFVEYRHRVDGTNNAMKSRYINFGLNIYF